MQTWFVFHLDSGKFKMHGPLGSDILVERLRARTLSWMDLVYTPEKPEHWSRLADVAELREKIETDWPRRDDIIAAESKIFTLIQNIPKQSRSPAVKAIPTVRPAALRGARPLSPPPPNGPAGGEAASPEPVTSTKLNSEKKRWYLQFDGTEFGPFAATEALEAFQSRGGSAVVFAWKRGIPTWVPVKTESKMKELLKSPSAFYAKFGNVERGSNQRAQPRRSLVATVKTQGRTLPLGICIDISLGGVQVLAQGENTLQTTKTFEIEIVPASIHALGPLKSRAKLAWKTPDRLGFQFVDVDPQTLARLQTYITKSRKGFEI